jgi:spore coat polysaccharide biosynthesis predicted glycosyltransferase SpsG
VDLECNLVNSNKNSIFINKQTKNKVMAKFYSVQVAIEVEDAKGKIKKQKENYLVDAMSVTEAEAKLVKKFVAEAVKLEYEVVKVSETNIIEVF